MRYRSVYSLTSLKRLTLYHNTSLYKLNHYGIEGVPLKLYENYSSNRTQYVELADVKSENLSILCIIYINDFSKANQIFNFISFADTTLLSTMNNFRNAHNDDADILINEQLYKTNEWLEINKLSLNVTKSKFMVFDIQKKNLNTFS